MLPQGNRRLASSVALALLLLGARSARADDKKWLELAWQAPSECPPGGDIEREIARLVGSTPKVKGPLRAVVAVSGDEHGWRARVRTDYAGELGERTIEGATCRAVAKAAALVISLTIDSNAGKVDANPPPPPPPPREPQLPPPPPPPLPPPPQPVPVHAFVALGPRTEMGLLENPTFGLELAMGVRVPAGSLEVAGAWHLPQNISVPGTAAGGRFTLLSLGGRLCPRIVRGPVELFVCAGGFYERLSAQGFGINEPGSNSTDLFSASLGPGMDFLLARGLWLTVAGDATYTPGHARFVLDNVGPVHTAARVGGTARLQLAWYF
jgi:hypothetical protein